MVIFNSNVSLPEGNEFARLNGRNLLASLCLFVCPILVMRSKVAFAKTPPPQPTDAPVKEVGLCQLVEFGAPKCGELAGHTFQGLLGR